MRATDGGDAAHIERVHAPTAGAAKHAGGLVDSVDDLRAVGRILDAWDVDIRPMTRSEIADAAGMSGDPDFDTRFDVLVAYGAVVQHRRKTGTAKWTPHPVALVSGDLLLSLEHESAADRLADLVVLALDRLDPDTDDPLNPDELAAVLDRLTRSVNVIAAQMDRAVDIGTTAELVAAAPPRRAERQVARVPDAVRHVRATAPELAGKVDRLVDATVRYATATSRLVTRLAEETRAAGPDGISTLFAILSEDHVRDVARTAAPDALAGVATDVLIDLPPVRIAPDRLTDAADALGTARPARQVPPAPTTGTSAADAVAATVAADRARRDRLRRWVLRQTADGTSDAFDDGAWPTPVAQLIDALEVASDETLPVTADVQQGPHVDPHGPVAVTHPVRLRRLDHQDTDTSPSAAETRSADA